MVTTMPTRNRFLSKMDELSIPMNVFIVTKPEDTLLSVRKCTPFITTLPNPVMEPVLTPVPPVPPPAKSEPVPPQVEKVKDGQRQ